MKFLPGQPPSPVSGRTIQGGPQGPFVRSGRPPVDTRRPRQAVCRGALGWTAKQWGTLSPGQQADWNALSVSGTDGAPKMSGRAVVSALSAPVPSPDPPATPTLGIPILGSLAWTGGSLLLSVSIVNGAPDRFDFWAGPPRPAADFTFFRDVIVDFSLSPAATTYDLTAGYVAAWGVPPSGYVLSARVVPSKDGLLGPTSGYLQAAYP